MNFVRLQAAFKNYQLKQMCKAETAGLRFVKMMTVLGTLLKKHKKTQFLYYTG